MLTGRPPFPGGTVLQKLIQHQEEAPADVRTLNPDVPAELSAIIAKLMAKERDRRYQGPEQLVRDLLTRRRRRARADLGRARALDGARPCRWERHLVWLLPALGVRRRDRRPGLVGSGIQQAAVDLGGPDYVGLRTPAATTSEVPGRSCAAESIPSRNRSRRARAETCRLPSADDPGNSNEDLLGILASAPRRSVIVLADEGPYLVGERSWSGQALAP